MNIFHLFADKVSAAVRAQLDESGTVCPPLDKLTVEPPRDPSHGDLATNAAMMLAKPLKLKPRALAEALAERLAADDDVQSVDVAGPGFINIRLNPDVWSDFLESLLAEGKRCGRLSLGGGNKVNVEYVSANPTGPMHVGHARGAVFGDVLANLLDYVGYDVTREYYINDAGRQIETLARSAHLRYREALGEDIGAIPEGLYPGDYLKPVGQVLVQKYGRDLVDQDESAWMADVSNITIQMMLDMIREDLAALNVRHDVFFSERSLITGETNRVEQAIDTLRERGDVFVGKLPPPKGQPSEDWEDREQTLFRATAYGDDVDRALLKSDGGYTYFASDIAYHYDKYLRGFTEQVNIFGADHGGYVKRLTAAVKAMSGGEATLTIRLCQLVKLFRGGVPVKMSKRSGDLVTLRDVVDEVGIDATRFMMLYRKNDAPLDFDFEAVQEKSRENPVFYVQYAHARCHSIFRQACRGEDGEPNGLSEDDWLATLPQANLSLLTDEGERALVKRMAEYPRILQAAAAVHEPHRVAFYLYELASDFHGHWNKGKDQPELRFVNHSEEELTKARLALVHAVRLVIASGLDIMGVSAPAEMT